MEASAIKHAFRRIMRRSSSNPDVCCFFSSENIYLVSCLAGVLFAQATIYIRYWRDFL